MKIKVWNAKCACHFATLFLELNRKLFYDFFFSLKWFSRPFKSWERRKKDCCYYCYKRRRRKIKMKISKVDYKRKSDSFLLLIWYLNLALSQKKRRRREAHAKTLRSLIFLTLLISLLYGRNNIKKKIILWLIFSIFSRYFTQINWKKFVLR